MARHELISDQLQALADRLPAPAVDELADGLHETYQAHLARTGDPDEAANATIADFGDADTITAAFLRHSPWRRAALTLLATGPLIGGLWAITLITSQAWTWPIPPAARVLAGATLIMVVVALVASVRTTRAYNRTRMATAGAATALVILDASMLATITTLAPHVSWPLTLAVTASAIRASATARMIPALTGS